MENLKKSNEANPFIWVFFIIICAIGWYIIINISASRGSMHYFYRQTFYMISGFGIALFASKLDIYKLKKYSGVAFLGCIAMLVLVLLVGDEVKGATRSINLGIVRIQPSILARIFGVIYFANFLYRKKDIIPDSRPSVFFSKFFVLLFLVAIAMGLILIERHLSSIIIMSVTFFLMLFLAGIRKLTLFIFVLAGIIALVFVITVGAEYRAERIEIFKKYSLVHRYLGISPTKKFAKEMQIKESLTALSSGGYFGRGEGKGMAKHLFLPEARTDYIFAIIGEEYGFVGGVIVILCYLFLFLSCFKSAWKHDNLFLRLVGCGLSLNIFLNVLINIGVAISALPSTGVTLPFISYGGTSYLINAASVGILIDISKPRKEIC